MFNVVRAYALYDPALGYCQVRVSHWGRLGAGGRRMLYCFILSTHRSSIGRDALVLLYFGTNGMGIAFIYTTTNDMQGIAFIVAVLLMHMGEEEAFITLTYLLNVVNLRELYMPVMEPLLICLFQFSRLLAERCACARWKRLMALYKGVSIHSFYLSFAQRNRLFFFFFPPFFFRCLLNDCKCNVAPQASGPTRTFICQWNSREHVR